MKGKFVGLNDLESDEKDLFENLCVDHCEKFEKHFGRFLKTDNEINLRIKKYDKDGNRVKYSLHLHLPIQKADLSASADDWDINLVCKEVFSKLHNEAKRHYKA